MQFRAQREEYTHRDGVWNFQNETTSVDNVSLGCSRKIDVVIPVALKDKDKLEKSVNGILKNSKTPINKIFIVAENLSILETLSWNNKNNKDIVGLSETIYPFSKNYIRELLVKNQSNYDHTSWYYQQLLKLYVFDAIPNICDNVLILDSDFIFIKPIEFLTSEGKGILSCGYPFQWLIGTSTYPNKNIKHSHINHARKLVRNWDIMNPFSGMHHHILFNKDIMKSLFQNVEEYNNEPFWKAFINNLDIDKWTSASEYVIYFHYVINNFKNQIELIHHNTVDIIYDSKDRIAQNAVYSLLDGFTQSKEPNLIGIGCHGFLDLKERLHTMDYIGEELRKTMLEKEENFYILQLNDKGALYVK